MSVSIQSKIYTGFKGVDFSTDPSLVDAYRSPYAPNMIADLSGMPEKRVGWRTLYTLETPINGIFEGDLGGEHYFVIHAGTKLYSWDGTNAPVLIKSGIANAKSTGFCFNVMTDTDMEIARIKGNKANDLNNDDTISLIKGTDFIFIMTGTEFLYYGKIKTLTPINYTFTHLTTEAYTEALTCGTVSDIAHVPLVKSLGVAYENINLVTPKRKMTVTPIQGSTQNITTGIKGLDGVDRASDGTVQVRFIFNEHVVHCTEAPDSTYLDVNGYPRDVYWYHFNAIRATGIIKIKAPTYAMVNGVFGATITQEEFNKGYTVEAVFTKAVAGYTDRINKCTVNAIYGYNSSDRVFFTGNPDYPNYDWYSAYKDPTYIEDLSYSTVGAISSAIVGYVRFDKYLAILKEDTDEDSTIYLRYGSVDSGGKITFPTFQSVAGTGAISSKAMGTLLGEPLFLSNTGIFAIVSNSLTDERTVQNRSYFVDSKLTKEENLQNAISTTWNGYFIVCVNGHCYLLDGKQNKSYKDKAASNFIYECYYWENIPATCFCNYKSGANENLYFGTSDGKFCRFNTDITTLDRFNDDGASITCAWATPVDDDGNPMRLKILLKKGGAATLKPYLKSSAKIYLRTDQQAANVLVNMANAETLDIFDWETFDFSRVTFNSNDGIQEVVFNKKAKNYKRLQILVYNDGLNEGFGIYKITKHFVYGNYAKR